MKTTLDLPPDLLQIAAAGGISLPDLDRFASKQPVAARRHTLVYLGPTPVAVANNRKLNSIVS
jgi:hypothetical protein